MSQRRLLLLATVATLVAGCQPDPAAGPVTAGRPAYGAPTGQPVYTPPTGRVAATPAAAVGSTQPPPKFDRNGNPNYDADGNYIGANGVGALVDSPETDDGIPDVTVPEVTVPDVSNMTCTGTSIENAGSLECSG